jgi:hypothetical protein
MKREWSHDRGITARFLSSNPDNQFDSALDFSVMRQQPDLRRRIFVIEQTSRLPSTNATGKKIRRILIYDNHPDSLRLVFGRGPNRRLSSPQRVGSWDLLIVSILAIAGLIVMFWPVVEIFVP